MSISNSTMPAHFETTAEAKSRVTMRRDAHRFHDLNDSGLLAIAFFHLSGQITEANDAFLKLVEYDRKVLERGELSWQRITDPHWLRVIEKALGDLREHHRCGPHEVRFCRPNGKTFWGMFQGAVIEGRDESLAFVQDVTIPKEMEQDLQETAAMLNRAQRIGGMGHWVYDVPLGSLTWSVQASDILMGSHCEPSGVISVFRPSARLELWENLTNAVTKRVPLRMTARIIRPSGEERVVYLEGDLDLDARGEPSRLIGMIQDVTDRAIEHEALLGARQVLESRVLERTQELANTNIVLQKEIVDRQRSEQARVELLRRVVTVQEDERRRISRELHDQMGQLLAALMLGMKSLEATDGLNEPLRDRIRLLRGMANEVGHEIHELALELRPAALDDLGLASALCQYVESWSTRTGVEADIHVGTLEVSRLPLPLELALYRIVQEALTNVTKHAQAKHVSVVLERRAEQLSMIVEDDGGGFNVEETLRSASARKRLGLLGITERLATLGGTLEVESDLLQGTTLYIRVPLPIPADFTV